MPRYKLTLEYDGSGFVGWQRQAKGIAVQQVLEEAVEAFAQEQRLVEGAGRTDTGVHALGQVAHVDLQNDWEPDRVRDALNFHVKPHPVVVLAVKVVDDDFHARFSATQRGYLYRILARRPPPAVRAGKVWWVPRPLDAAAMNAAARHLIGKHDFSTFRAANCQADSPVKTLDEIDVRSDGDEILITVRARSFLYRQVRNIAGTLKLAGEGKWTPDDVRDALAACDRERGGPTAPPDGLYLTDVAYGA